MYRDLLFLADVSVQISAISSNFSVIDYEHVLLIFCDIFSSMFLYIWKFKMESSSLDISKHTSRITLIVPIYHQITKKAEVYADFQGSVVTMRCFPFEKY